MHIIDRDTLAAHAELETLQGRDPADVYAEPEAGADRPVPSRCDICNGYHSTIICQLEGKVAPRGFRRWWEFHGPMYDYGREDTFRLAATERDFSDESQAEVYYFRVQFLGFHFELKMGRTPPAIPDAEVMERKRRTIERNEYAYDE